MLQYPGAADLDAGEKELLAYAITLKEKTYFISSSDRACVRAGLMLDMLDSFISLEELVQDAGLKVQLNYQFSKSWLNMAKTELKLENL